MKSKVNVLNVLIYLLLFLPLPFIVWKLCTYDINWKQARSVSCTQYDVKYTFKVEENLDKPIHIEFILPEANKRQSIISENVDSKGLNIEISKFKEGRRIVMSGIKQVGDISCRFKFIGKSQIYKIPSELKVDDLLHNGDYRNFTTFLKNHFLNSSGSSLKFIKHISKDGFKTRSIVGYDLSSDNPKQLFWSEILINNIWMPFCVEKGYFAEIPSSFLKLCYVDMNKHNEIPKIPVELKIKIEKEKLLHPDIISELENKPLNWVFFNRLFEEQNLPAKILRIILLTPLVAMIISIFRNAIGLNTFGLFLPMLLAMSFLTTGFFAGAAMFLLIIGLISIVHYPLEKFELLNLPKLAIVLTFVELLFLGIVVVGAKFHLEYIIHISMFPVVIITFASERFSKVATEKNYKAAFILTFKTLFVAGATFLIYNSLVIELIFQIFPELILSIIGVNLILGKWIGLRFTELLRFKTLTLPTE